jgi:F-type H+-transporting ATPase subunit gamma
LTRLADIERHIGSMTELLDIVGAMRSLASMRLQEAQRALPGMRSYAEAVAAAIADTLPLVEGVEGTPTVAGGRLALVLCSAEHGFVGGFNEHLMEAALARIGPDDALLVLGTRGATLSAERGRPADWTHPMASRCPAVPEAVNRLSLELYRRIAGGEVGRVEVMFARCRAGGGSTIERHPVLPVDPASLGPGSLRQPPIHTLPPAVLQEKLVGEYVFALLAEALVESLASENAARFLAMEAARDNVSRKLAELGAEARHARQSEITDELLDLVTGAEAVTRGG